MHNVFHVSMLKKYVADHLHVLHYEPLEVRGHATCIEQLMAIIDTEEHVLRTKTIHWVKVQWEHHSPEEAMWELRDEVQV